MKFGEIECEVDVDREDVDGDKWVRFEVKASDGRTVYCIFPEDLQARQEGGGGYDGGDQTLWAELNTGWECPAFFNFVNRELGQ